MSKRLIFFIYLLSDIDLPSINNHCVKSVRIWSYSGSYFPVSGQNTESSPVSLRIQSECGKIRISITPNKDFFHAANVTHYDSAWFINRKKTKKYFLFSFLISAKQ